MKKSLKLSKRKVRVISHKFSYNQWIHFRSQNSVRWLVFEKYHRYFDQQVKSTNKSRDTQIGKESHDGSVYCLKCIPGTSSNESLIKRQPHTSVSRYRFKGKVKTDQFDIWIRNANYILKFRGISKTQSNMFDGDFLRKYLTAFSR